MLSLKVSMAKSQQDCAKTWSPIEQIFKLFKSTTYKIKIETELITADNVGAAATAQASIVPLVKASDISMKMFYLSSSEPQEYKPLLTSGTSSTNEPFNFKLFNHTGNTIVFTLKLNAHTHLFQEPVENDLYKSSPSYSGKKFNTYFKFQFLYQGTMFAELSGISVFAKKRYDLDCFGNKIEKASKRVYCKKKNERDQSTIEVQYDPLLTTNGTSHEAITTQQQDTTIDNGDAVFLRQQAHLEQHIQQTLLMQHLIAQQTAAVTQAAQAVHGVQTATTGSVMNEQDFYIQQTNDSEQIDSEPIDASDSEAGENQSPLTAFLNAASTEPASENAMDVNTIMLDSGTVVPDAMANFVPSLLQDPSIMMLQQQLFAYPQQQINTGLQMGTPYAPTTVPILGADESSLVNLVPFLKNLPAYV